MKRTSAMRELWVGVLLTISFVVFFVLLISLGEQQNLLLPKTTYHAFFQQTQGLAVGAPVRLEGVPIGSVTAIDFPEDPNDFRIIVTFQVDRTMAPRIREDTKALIVSQGIIGEVLLGLKRGSTLAPPAEPDTFLPTIETGTLEEFKTQGQVIAENILAISSDISRIMERIENGEGMLARLLTDDEYAQAFLQRIDRTSQAMEEIVHKLNEGESFLGRLLAAGDPKATAAADDVFEAIERINTILARVEGGEGTLGRLINEDTEFESLVTSLSEMSASVKNLTQEIEEGDGLLGKLIRDETWANEVMTELRQTSKDISDIVSELKSGEGTLGALLKDPSIYEGLNDLVGGVQKNRVLRWFIRRNVARGAEAELEETRESGKSPGRANRRKRE